MTRGRTRGGALHAAVAVALLTVAAPLSAAVDPARLIACSAEVDDAKRLACYDAAVAAASAEARTIAARREAAREKAAAEKAAADARAAAEAAEAARKAQADRFGQEGLRLGGSPDRLDELQARIAETRLDRVGEAVFLLDNGQMWRQTDGLSLPPVRAGDAVEIKRGALGGYRLTVPRVKRTVRVVRMR